MHILNNYVLLNILLLFVIKSNHHFQTERYLFFIFNPRTSRHWIINYSFQSRHGRQTGAGETGGLEINISIIFTLYISTRLQRTYCFIQVGCHVTIHVPFHLNCSIRERRHSTQFGLRLKSELWRMLEGGGCGAQPSPARAIRSWFAVAKFLPYLPFLHKSDNWVSNIFICPAPVLPPVARGCSEDADTWQILKLCIVITQFQCFLWL